MTDRVPFGIRTTKDNVRWSRFRPDGIFHAFTRGVIERRIFVSKMSECGQNCRTRPVKVVKLRYQVRKPPADQTCLRCLLLTGNVCQASWGKGKM